MVLSDFGALQCLLLGRKPMANIDSILKSRDITLPTKVHIVKALVVPVVMYGCDSWIIRLNIKELILLNREGQVSLACGSPWSHKE